jgi:ferric-dicitrate binding protein FerR (iron transport regulator)
MNTVSTPYGGQYKVLLPDGSKVYLNAGSTISYPFFFDQKTRSVSLSGEAYFEVAKDKSRPFVVSVPRTVNVPDQKITVLGTHFNISAYPDERAYTTTLLEGSVKVSSSEKNISEVLVPGQQAVLAKTLKIGPADTDGALAWKNGVFYFANQPIDRVMRELERWYNIEVQYQGEMPRVGFWGQISRNKMLSDVLRDLEYTNSIHFKIEGRRVTVMQ